jgi:hypothetical protein
MATLFHYPKSHSLILTAKVEKDWTHMPH